MTDIGAPLPLASETILAISDEAPGRAPSGPPVLLLHSITLAGVCTISLLLPSHGRLVAFVYRTLAEILNSVRGFYTTYDRNYAYVGVRGFARPGDYNTRVLLLVDGHRLNEPIYDMAPIGTDFPIDVSLISSRLLQLADHTP